MGRIGQVAWNKGMVSPCPRCHIRPKKKSGKCRECMTAYMKEYRKANPELMRQLAARFNLRHPDRRRAYYTSDHGRLMSRLGASKTRARWYGLRVDTITPADWNAILDYFGYRCAYCLVGGPLQQDHIVPITKGGGTTIDNIVPACGRCNKKKGNRNLLHLLRAA